MTLFLYQSHQGHCPKYFFPTPLPHKKNTIINFFCGMQKKVNHKVPFRSNIFKGKARMSLLGEPVGCNRSRLGVHRCRYQLEGVAVDRLTGSAAVEQEQLSNE